MLQMETDLKQERSLNAKLMAELTSQAEATMAPGKLRRLFRRKSQATPKGPQLEPEPLPAGWEEKQSRSSGDKYYVDVVSNESTFKRPRTASLPVGWTHSHSRQNGELFFISPAGETTFDPPPTSSAPAAA